MLEDYLIVHKSILPAYFEAVLKARELIEDGRAENVTQAVRKVGISRSTYYKYKDYILEPSYASEGRKAVFSLMLEHETGILSAVLNIISKACANVLTITQSLPIKNKASVIISVDISRMPASVSTLLEEITRLKGVESARLIAVE